MSNHWLDIFSQIEPKVQYSFVCLTDLAVAASKLSGQSEKVFRRRFRMYVVGLAKLLEFPRDGDDTLFLFHTMKTPAWSGKRWRDAAVVAERLKDDKAHAFDLVRPHWTQKMLLEQSKIFSLEDVSFVLDLHADLLKKLALASPSPWDSMGVEFGRYGWIVHMELFSKWYQSNYLQAKQKDNEC